MLNVLSVKELIERICKWNSLRFEQEYNHELNVKLLLEECGELSEATSVSDKVEVCDALGDIFYVAVGAMWKAAIPNTNIYEYVSSYTASDCVPIDWQLAVIVSLLADGNQFMSNWAKVISYTLKLLTQVTESEDNALAVLTAIVISNDTKEVKKTASNVKANLVKGNNYKPPTETIKQILGV